MSETTGRVRQLDRIPAPLIEEAIAQLLALVDRRLPERFWPGEPTWRVGATALMARAADTLDSIALLLPTRRQSDTLALLRMLYEHVVTFGWLAIDPERRFFEWMDAARVARLKLHRDATAFGLSLMSEADVAEAASFQRLLPLDQRADEVDAYWGSRITGWHTDPDEGHRSLLTLRGLYLSIYRLGSRPVHAEATPSTAASTSVADR